MVKFPEEPNNTCNDAVDDVLGEISERLSSGEPVDIESGQTAKYLCKLQFAPDGKRIATSSPDGTVRLWDVESGQELLMFRTQAVYYPQLAFSPSGSKLLIASGNESFVVTTSARNQLQSLSVAELTEIPCQTSISPWRKFEAIPDG